MMVCVVKPLHYHIWNMIIFRICINFTMSAHNNNQIIGGVCLIYKIDMKKRTAAEKLVYAVMDELDPSGTNTKRYKKLFSTMSDAKFENFMRCMFDDNNMNFTLEIKDFDREVTIEQIKKAAKILNIPLEEHVILPHITMSQAEPMVTKEKCIVGFRIEKRMEQINNHKNSTSTHISERSSTTGQVVGHDKNGRSSDVENVALKLIGAEAILQEINGFRADGLQRKNYAYNQIARSGSCSLKDIEAHAGISDRLALETLDVYYKGMALHTDLITPDLLLIDSVKKS